MIFKDRLKEKTINYFAYKELFEANYEVSLSEIEIRTKQDGKDLLGKITNGFKTNPNIKTFKTPQELAEVLISGKSLSVCIFEKGERSEDKFKGTYLIPFDFDSNYFFGTNETDIIGFFDKMGLPLNILHTTLSHTEINKKYRGYIILANKITCPIIYKNIVSVFMDIFSYFFSDKKVSENVFDKKKGENVSFMDLNCKNVNRIFLGGKDALYIDELKFPYQDVMEILNYILKQIEIDKLAKKKGLKKEDAEKEINKRKVDRVYRDFYVGVERPQIELLKNFNFVYAIENLKVLQDFTKGIKLDYNDLKILLLNLKFIEGGLVFAEKVMLEYKEIYNENKFNLLKNLSNKYLNHYTHPSSFKGLSSVYECDKDYLNLLDLKEERGLIIDKRQKKQKMNIQSAESLLKEFFSDYLRNSVDNEIYVIKTSTGLGKTREIINSVKVALRNKKSIAIGFPTHLLKEEVYKKVIALMPNEKSKISYTPNLNNYIFSDEALSIIEEERENGLPLKKIVNVLINKGSCNDISECVRYLTDLENSKKSQIVLTTHKRLLMDKFEHEYIIFDEDIIQSCIDIKSIPYESIEKFCKEFNHLNFLERIEKSENCVEKNNFVGFDIKSLRSFCINNSVNYKLISGFIKSSYFIFNKESSKTTSYISFVNNLINNQTLRNKKVLVCSATADNTLQDYLWSLNKMKVKVFKDISNVESYGSVIQYTQFSNTKTSLNKRIEKLVELVGGLNNITFKDVKFNFEEVNDCHFGNTSGYDHLKGKDLVVLGTQTPSKDQVILTAASLEIPFKSLSYSYEISKVSYKDFTFKYNCYSNEILRQIQFFLIESELIQAVGRARTTRENCVVVILSGFPLYIADEIKTKYPKTHTELFTIIQELKNKNNNSKHRPFEEKYKETKKVEDVSNLLSISKTLLN